MTNYSDEGFHQEERHLGDDPSLRDLCRIAAQTSGIASVTIVVSGRQNREGAVAHSDGVAASAHSLEFTLGEGPTTDVLSTATPTLDCHLDTAFNHWSQFAPAALRLDIFSISAIPLRVGAIRLGALTFYAREPRTGGDLRSKEAFAIADAVISALLNSAGDIQHGTPASGTEATTYRAVVHQATGMVAAQLKCDMTDALLRLRALAYANSESVEQVARAVLNRRLRVEA